MVEVTEILIVLVIALMDIVVKASICVDVSWIFRFILCLFLAILEKDSLDLLVG